MSSSLARRAVVPPGVLVRELEGEAVLLDLETETYFGLDAVGARMWTAMTTSPTLASALERLEEEFEVDRVRLERDLVELAEKLFESRLLRLGDD